MNAVWPVTATYGTLFALWGWFALAYGSSKGAMDEVMRQHHNNGDSHTQKHSPHADREDTITAAHSNEQHDFHSDNMERGVSKTPDQQQEKNDADSCGDMSMKEMMDMMPSNKKPFWLTVLVGTTHCGAGCVLGDIVGEWTATVFTVGGYEMFASWLIDFTFAYAFGIFYQFWTIKPMRQTGVWDSLKSAIVADSLSIASFQVGMYAWMAIFQLVIFVNGAPNKL